MYGKSLYECDFIDAASAKNSSCVGPNTYGLSYLSFNLNIDGPNAAYLPDFSNKSTGRSIGIVTSFAPALFISSLIIFSTF